MNAYQENQYYLTPEEMDWEQHLDEKASVVENAIHNAGVHNPSMCKMFADLLAYTHENWIESEYLADLLEIDVTNIWCYKRDVESISKYKNYLR